MQELDLNKIKNVHFVGIGGIGISAIARMMLHQNKIVTGQDMQDSEIIEELRKVGAWIIIGQSYENIPDDTDLIVYTIAILDYDLKFFERICNSGILYKSYPQMLHYITQNKYTIAISGTHGKTTTTAMIAKILIDAKKDPSVIVGSLLKENNSNLIIGKSKYFIVEACEYRRSFLNINPKILVITNIEEDHLDYYKDLNDIKNAFYELCMKVPAGGFVVCNSYDKNIIDVIKNINAKVVNYEEFFNENLKLKIPGIHNKKNSAVAIAVADILNIDKNISKKILQNFEGTWRRLEYKGRTSMGTIIYDDYAHHPTEIRASIQALRELYKVGEKKITIVFQPHLYSRTKALFEDFSKCFKGVDQIILLPIYFAREKIDPTISSDKLAEEICKEGDQAIAFSDFKSAEIFLKSQIFGENDIFVTMGAGEAYKIADNILN